MNPVLSIIILNYNTKDLLIDCLRSLDRINDEVNFEVIVVDNGSTDDSVVEISNLKPQISNLKLKVIKNEDNLGFGVGNNKAKDIARGKYILFLNTDTIVHKDTLKKCVEYLDKHDDVGALTCRVELNDGSLDKDTRRSFITPWIGFVHIFTGLDRLFPNSKLFAKYWYGYIPENITHEVDAIQGAFFMSPKKILDKVNWFDEDYFLDGEDVDLSWKIKELGYKNIYFPEVRILHLKGVTKGKNKISKKDVPLKEKAKYRMSGVNSMEIFVRKRLWNKYPLPLMLFVLMGIRLLKLVRYIKLIIQG